MDLETKNRTAPPSAGQKEMLVNFLNTHKELVSGKFTKTFSFKDAEKLWNEIATTLNKMERGAQKSWRQWRKTWHDLRQSNVKKRSIIRRTMQGTGGGGPSTEKWEPHDDLLDNLVCKTIITGDPKVLEPTIYGISSPRHLPIAEVAEITHTEGPTFDHTYSVPPQENTPVQENLTPMTSSDAPILQPRQIDPNTPTQKQTPQPKRKRLTKEARLSQSQAISQEMLQLSKDNLNIQKKKLQLMEERNKCERSKVKVQKGLLRKLSTLQVLLSRKT